MQVAGPLVASVTVRLTTGQRFDPGFGVALALTVLGGFILTRDDVMEGIPEMIHEVQVEATFPDGTKLVTIHDPIQ